MAFLRGIGMILAIVAGTLLGLVLTAGAVYFAILYALGLPLKEWRFF